MTPFFFQYTQVVPIPQEGRGIIVPIGAIAWADTHHHHAPMPILSSTATHHDDGG